MQRLIVVVILCLLTLAALGQSTSKYQIGMITGVKAHQVEGESASDPTSYDVSVKVGGTTYVVLYTPTLGDLPPKDAIGHELLVLVGKNTITYNDILGRSLQVPIESQKPATENKYSKSLVPAVICCVEKSQQKRAQSTADLTCHPWKHQLPAVRVSS